MLGSSGKLIGMSSILVSTVALVKYHGNTGCRAHDTENTSNELKDQI